MLVETNHVRGSQDLLRHGRKIEMGETRAYARRRLRM
jgi:hypothetical protein